MKKLFYVFLSGFLFLICLFGLNSQQKLPPPEKHEVTVRLVLVDVVATDKDGFFVRDLKKGDFEIYEDGKKVTIDSFELVSFVSKTEAQEKPAVPEYSPALDRRKHLAVIFDSVNTIKRELDRSKPEILERLVSLIQQGNEIMVLEFPEKGGMTILQPFTANDMLIAQAVKKASGSIWVDKASEALYTPRILQEFDEQRDDDFYGIRSYQSGEVMYYYQTLPRFEKTVTGLLSAMNLLKDYPGRKSVLLISGGIPEMSILKIFGTFELDINRAHSDLDLAGIHDPFKVLHKSKHRSGDQIIKDLIEFANSHNISLYTMDPDNYLRHILPDVSKDNFPRALVDIRSAYPSDKVASIESAELSNLDFLAQETGGFSLQGAKKYEKFKEVVDQDLSAYYELSYTPPRKKADGKYHKISVKVKRPGLKIRFREGYYDYTAEQNDTLTFASTFYNPSLFKDIALEAWTYTFMKEKDKFILWFNIALPLRELIPEDYDRTKPKILKLKIWMVKGKGDLDEGTEMTMPIVLTPEILQRLKGRPSYIFNCCSGELKLKENEYRVIFVIRDDEFSKTGTYEEEFVLPGSQGLEAPQVSTVFFGYLADRQGGGGAFQVSGGDSALQLRRYKFLPMELNIFRRETSVALLTQFFVSDKNASIEPRFVLVENGLEKGEIPAKIIDKSWNKKVNLWSMVYKLDFSAFRAGSYVLHIKGNVDTSALEADLRVRIY